jgi:transposase
VCCEHDCQIRLSLRPLGDGHGAVDRKEASSADHRRAPGGAGRPQGPGDRARVPGLGGRREQHVAEFATTVRGLLELRDWLAGHGVTQVVMEATGVYWKAPWAILEDEFDCMLVSARHVKQVPGRKTDVSDAAWLCLLAEAGLLKANFVPPKPIRQLRNLTRYRKTQIQERAREVNRLHKALEDACIAATARARRCCRPCARSARHSRRALLTSRQQRAEAAGRRRRYTRVHGRVALSSLHRACLNPLLERGARDPEPRAELGGAQLTPLDRSVNRPRRQPGELRRL